jgi:uncharacterized protein (TIGR03435 family)
MQTKYLAMLLLIPAAWPQSPAAKPVFEAASIKMTAPTGGGGNSYSRGTPGLLRASMTLKSYIMMAYNLRQFQVAGGPKWMDDSTYDIVAKLEHEFMPEHATGKQLNEATLAALRSLLADRFQLKVHHETKEMPAYVLTAIKGRFHLTPIEQAEHCGTSSKGDARGVKFTAMCISIADFATTAANRLDLPVSDQTHIDGLYTFSLEWSRDGLRADASGDANANPDAPPSFFTAVEQIGLKLESRKAPVDVLVVDSAERPSEN